MGIATLGPHTFRLDPTSILWDFSIVAKEIPTVGGKVVQVLGAHLGDMTVSGSFGVGGWQEQAAFLAEMKAIGDSQVSAQRIPNSQVPPIRFRYPPKGWDFGVYLTGYQQPGAGRSVQLDSQTVNLRWQLTLFLVEGTAGLKQIAQDVFIARLSAGIGWKQTVYNGPMNSTDVEAVLQGRSITQYLNDQMTGTTSTSGAAASSNLFQNTIRGTQ